MEQKPSVELEVLGDQPLRLRNVTPDAASPEFRRRAGGHARSKRGTTEAQAYDLDFRRYSLVSEDQRGSRPTGVWWTVHNCDVEDSGAFVFQFQANAIARGQDLTVRDEPSFETPLARAPEAALEVFEANADLLVLNRDDTPCLVPRLHPGLNEANAHDAQQQDHC